MILRSETIQKWWPTTQALDIVEGSVEAVAAALQAEVRRFLAGEAISTSWEGFLNLDAAFCSASEFTNVPTTYLVLPTRSKWSVLWNNSFLCNGYDSLCHNLTKNHGLTTLHWSAHDEWTSFQSGASFTHRRKDGAEIVERSVAVAQEDKRWLFYAHGQPLAEEDIESYKARRKQDRLDEEKISAFLSRLGATPWLEQFYGMPATKVFVLRRQDAPSRITRRRPEEVLQSLKKNSTENQSRRI
jgi:hypothetical protein